MGSPGASDLQLTELTQKNQVLSEEKAGLQVCTTLTASSSGKALWSSPLHLSPSVIECGDNMHNGQ